MILYSAVDHEVLSALIILPSGWAPTGILPDAMSLVAKSSMTTYPSPSLSSALKNSSKPSLDVSMGPEEVTKKLKSNWYPFSLQIQDFCNPVPGQRVKY